MSATSATPLLRIAALAAPASSPASGPAVSAASFAPSKQAGARASLILSPLALPPSVSALPSSFGSQLSFAPTRTSRARHLVASGRSHPARSTRPTATPADAPLARSTPAPSSPDLPAALGAVGRALPETASFPLLLLAAALVFLAVQHRFDRKDPKLAAASAQAGGALSFDAPRRHHGS